MTFEAIAHFTAGKPNRPFLPEKALLLAGFRWL
jgi:hypothetical protein